MEICDFSYRGERLSSRGYIMCDFDGGTSASPITTDSQKAFASISVANGKRFPFLYYTYNESLVIQIDICKADEDLIITPGESAKMKRWLNSPVPEKFRLVNSDYDGYFWLGSFNVSEIRTGVDIVGLRLTLTTTAPFGYKDEITFKGDVEANGTIKIKDIGDEEGYIYPDISIELKSAGDLTITNSFDGRSTVMKNCEIGETITFTSALQMVTDSATHDIYKDFNYRFLRINNTFSDEENNITFSLPCSYEISYNPIAKVVFA